MKGDKVVAICDRNCNVIAPMIFAPGNRHESPLIREAMKPNINPNKRNRKQSKRGRKPLFDLKLFKERFRTIERIFA
ncbi:hypothetical protein [Candidatus Paracaedibacter symbiosus]|uniref:hypothetical protein n=1 Tax=Candidatus Paracaedibacter symbiosus TaxID=244582 RepID=UPI0018DBADAE|nr:hypothetical protein [Candidatus Paracaedibacter symbiosus]